MTRDSDSTHPTHGPRSPDGRCYGYLSKRCRKPVDRERTMFWCPECNAARRRALESHDGKAYLQLAVRFMAETQRAVTSAYFMTPCGRWWANVFGTDGEQVYLKLGGLLQEYVPAERCACDRRTSLFDRNGMRVRT